MNSNTSKNRKPAWKSFIIAFISSLILISICKLTNFELPVYRLTNEFCVAAYQASKDPGPIDSNIYIINIKDYPLEVIRSQIAIASLYEPAVIGVDYFPTEEEMSDLDQSDTSVVDFTRVVLPITIDENLNYAPNCFSKYASYGSVASRSYSFFEPYVNVNGQEIPSFPTKILQLYDSSLFLKMKARTTETEIINFNGNLLQFRFLDDLSTAPPGALEFLKGKIVLVGYVGVHDSTYPAPDDDDVKPTPAGKMYGLVFMANQIHTILGNYIDTIPQAVAIVVTLMIVLLNLFVTKRLFGFRFSYVFLKIFQMLQIITCFLVASYLLMSFNIFIDYSFFCLVVLITVELGFWSIRIIGQTSSLWPYASDKDPSKIS